MDSATNYKPFKPELLRRSHCMHKLREEIRKQFHDKLKLDRYNELYRRRELFNNVMTNVTNHYEKIQKGLLVDVEEVAPEEMLNIMLEVESEVFTDHLQNEADQAGIGFDYDLTQNLTICSICNIVIKRNDNLPCLICDSCAKLHFSANF